jgi:uncharacterized membrane protein
VPERLIAWRSLPGSEVDNAGRVRFEEISPGRTRIDVRMCYAPPAGVIGHGVASLLGVDPQRALEDDLLRVKSLLEEKRTSAHGKRVTREELR